jgi:hypothetical protein
MRASIPPTCLYVTQAPLGIAEQMVVNHLLCALLPLQVTDTVHWSLESHP